MRSTTKSTHTHTVHRAQTHSSQEDSAEAERFPQTSLPTPTQMVTSARTHTERTTVSLGPYADGRVGRSIADALVAWRLTRSCCARTARRVQRAPRAQASALGTHAPARTLRPFMSGVALSSNIPPPGYFQCPGLRESASWLGAHTTVLQDCRNHGQVPVRPAPRTSD